MKTMEDTQDEFEVLKWCVAFALDRFYENDAELLSLGVGEMCLVGNFYRYFHTAILERFRDPALRIDVEYDRIGTDCHLKQCLPGMIIRPDLLVHHRGYSSRNLCAIEFKRADRVRDLAWVRRKLRACTHTDRLGYHYGCYVEFGADRVSCRTEWYVLHGPGQRAQLDSR